VKFAEQASLNNGGAKASFVAFPHPIQGVGKDGAYKKAEEAWPDLLKAATEWTPPASDPNALKQDAAYPAATFTFKGTTTEVSQMFYDKGWSEGIPITPPTPEKVAAMLKGTTRKPNEVIWEVPPRKGQLTVELVATYAVMAGCKPSYMPVLLAAVDAMKDPDLNYNGPTTSTHPSGVLVVVNGPIAKKIGLVSGRGAAGGGYQANSSIGYALSLITDIVGDSRPQTNDQSTLGWAGNMIATVVAENVDESPWEPFSTTRGFSKDDNVVSVFLGGPPANIKDQSAVDSVGILKVFADTVNYAGQNTTCAIDKDVVLLICPQYAEKFTAEGFDREKVKAWLWENAREPAGKTFPDKCDQCASKSLNTKVDNDTMVPTVSNPDHFQIIVVGGAGAHAQYWPGYSSWLLPNTINKTMVSVKVKE
jgi:hypothetical protein